MSKQTLFLTFLIVPSFGCSRIYADDSTGTNSSSGTTEPEGASKPDETHTPTTIGSSTGTSSDTTGMTGGLSKTDSSTTFMGSSSTTTGPAVDTGLEETTIETTGSIAVCGDGDVEGIEECDDGNNLDNDKCPSGEGACLKLAECGDGFIHTGVEDCDDGNRTNNDDCTNMCSHCGNGKLELVFDEACDDGNFSNEDACSSTCEKLGRLSFITSTPFLHGSIVFPNNNTESAIDDADMHCWKLAQAALQESPEHGLSWHFEQPNAENNPFKAWLSDNTHSPANPRNGFNVCADSLPYILHDGTIVADSFPDLVSHGPSHAINIDEQGNKIVNDEPVWTGTNQSGMSTANTEDCRNWKGANDKDDAVLGWRGLSRKQHKLSDLAKTWTEHDNPKCWNTTARLYCFEQCPE